LLRMSDHLHPFSLAMIRGFMGRCPQCGHGKLFASYLKPVRECAACGEGLGHIRADDGPAWATILLVGHILAPFLLGILPNSPWPDWMLIVTIVPAILILTLILLPRMKGVFIGMIWRSGCVGSEK
jgi:uncharacterized protein (DUF983 family)